MTHKVKATQTTVGNHKAWQGTCSCGWTGTPFFLGKARAAAMDEARGHRDEKAGA